MTIAKRSVFFLFCGVFISILAFSLPKMANAFSAGYLISDFDFYNYKSMSLQSIKEFLQSQPGPLKDKIFATDSGNKNAATIIYEVAQNAKISPKVIITTLQKEQSLITTTPSYESVYARAMGYGCPDSGGCNARWASFYKQVNGASLQLAWDANNPSTYKPGSTYTIDGQRVSIQNGPTGALYKYTPHIHGNQLFVNIWNRWFQIVHPDGTLLRADGEPGIWLIYQGKRYGFYSRIAFETRGFSPSYIVNVPKQAVLSYEKGGGFDFANYSLVSDQSGNRYLLDGIYKRKIPSEKIFQELGFLVEEVVPYTEMNRLQRDAVNTMPLGSDVQSPKRVAYPTGVLVQDVSTGAIGYLQDGIMHILHSGEVLRTQFAGRTWVRISHEKFVSYHIGSPVRLRDGTIVKSPKYGAKLFLISNGQRRPIMSAETFFGLGLKLENIMTTTDRVMDLHPLGKPLEAPQE